MEGQNVAKLFLIIKNLLIESGHLILQAGNHYDEGLKVLAVIVFHYRLADFGTFQHPFFPCCTPINMHLLVVTVREKQTIILCK